MPRLKCTGYDVIAILEARGFILHRHDGTSHRRYRGVVDGNVKYVDVAVHNLSDDIPVGTLGSIVRQSGLPKKLFRK
ncbi:type II toxin-antitoxin system HicA family toxin [Sinorhizobium fredii]|uniref:type II toxin-antitoxin system HicA family toxin n=1 Tax=Rhizobium fredii TaxID=380 RepID=UPI0009B64445|nr:type II toxin-antitoxin system HicA family toxin [Sinorhizobium fredii]